MARLVAAKMSEQLGQQMVIDNRGGGGGIVGTDLVAKATPDGHTFFTGGVGYIATDRLMFKNPGYDPVKSFAAVAKVADSTTVMIVPSNFPANSVKEFVAYAKANPGKLSYASGSSSAIVSGATFAKRAGIDLLHVPYKGGAPAATAMIGIR